MATKEHLYIVISIALFQQHRFSVLSLVCLPLRVIKQSINLFVYLNPLGAYLDIWFGWRSVFVFLMGLGIFITLLMITYVTDTQIAYRHLSLEVLHRYGKIVTNLNFLCFAFCAGVGLAVFFSFFSSSSFILIKILGVHEAEFGVYFGLVGVIYMVGSIVGAQVALRIGVFNTCFIGAIFVLIGTIAMPIIFVLDGLSLPGFLLPLFITKVIPHLHPLSLALTITSLSLSLSLAFSRFLSLSLFLSFSRFLSLFLSHSLPLLSNFCIDRKSSSHGTRRIWGNGAIP